MPACCWGDSVLAVLSGEPSELAMSGLAMWVSVVSSKRPPRRTFISAPLPGAEQCIHDAGRDVDSGTTDPALPFRVLRRVRF